ncbi:MAG: helix-hairpin-helix domain-containing protein, partial [Thermoplasmata archaeon]
MPGGVPLTVRIDDFPACSACGGKLLPLVLCDTCGAATILRDAQNLDRAAACSECETFNPWQLICDQCHTRYPAPGVPAGPHPSPGPPSPGPGAAPTPPPRPRRRIKGDVDTRALTDLLKVLGLDASRAQALVDRGYDVLWKIARAKEEELARIPEVGPVAARKMIASFQLLKYAPPKRTKESIAQDEYVCPLCRCVTSAFAARCVECGATFEEEEMEQDIRKGFLAEGDAALLAFYDSRLGEKPDDLELSYARGLLLESLGRVDDAIAALDRANAHATDAKKIRVAQLRIRAKHLRTLEVAAKLRSTTKALLDDVSWEQEVAQLNQLILGEGRRCPHCEAVVPAEMALCPSCGGRLFGPSVPMQTKSRESSPTPELDAVVDDILVGELEESLTEQQLELTKAAVLDWLIEELSESMAPETQVIHPSAKPPEEAEPAKSSPLTESIGFLSRWMRGSRGLVS